MGRCKGETAGRAEGSSHGFPFTSWQLKGTLQQLLHSCSPRPEEKGSNIDYLNTAFKSNYLNVQPDTISVVTVLVSLSLTSSWMYWMRKGEARRLSTGKLKKPWISFWWRSMVMMWVSPETPKTRGNRQVKFTYSSA